MDEGKCNQIEKDLSKRLKRLNDNIEGLIDGANLSDDSSINKICELYGTSSSYLKELNNHKKGVIKTSIFYEVFDTLHKEANYLQRRLYTNFKDIIKYNINH